MKPSSYFPLHGSGNCPNDRSLRSPRSCAKISGTLRREGAANLSLDSTVTTLLPGDVHDVPVDLELGCCSIEAIEAKSWSRQKNFSVWVCAAMTGGSPPWREKGARQKGNKGSGRPQRVVGLFGIWQISESSKASCQKIFLDCCGGCSLWDPPIENGILGPRPWVMRRGAWRCSPHCFLLSVS